MLCDFANAAARSELTSPCLNALSDIPMNEYYEYFGPNYRLDVPQNNTEDLNTPEYLDKIKTQVFENLRHTGGGGGAPSVQMQREWSPRIPLLCGFRCYMHGVSKLTAVSSWDSLQLSRGRRWTKMTMSTRTSGIRTCEGTVSSSASPGVFGA